MSKKISERDEDINKDYIGNIWGWKVSFISLAVILFMLMMVFWRYNYIKTHNPEKLNKPLEMTY